MHALHLKAEVICIQKEDGRPRSINNQENSREVSVLVLFIMKGKHFKRHPVRAPDKKAYPHGCHRH